MPSSPVQHPVPTTATPVGTVAPPLGTATIAAASPLPFPATGSPCAILPQLPAACCAVNRLALYVYEYLLHVGAQKSAQTFLSEIRWEKNITLGEPPGFLHSWWCVFWDLYCAAPERRETCEHSSEAKAFHDYGKDS
ncbi:hypothetical protein Y1Q_0004049 [Alligator mississippiensis]|uniref:Uncharacterized protein n=1 Tax=Alligator mississippiensis TaxID=8496 RepID=A0A151PHZ0_ALLMI|nr:hypothetical protein Y1Q_0004049 [Alligator mississippiensis]